MLVQGALLAAGILMPIYVQSLLCTGCRPTVSAWHFMPGANLMGIAEPALPGKWF
ncbi:MAG: hypothetical protein ACLTSX_13670 [Collinsella sp.]